MDELNSSGHHESKSNIRSAFISVLVSSHSWRQLSWSLVAGCLPFQQACPQQMSDISSLQKPMLLLRTGMRVVTPCGVVTEQSIVHVKMSASAIKSSRTRVTRIKSSPRRLSEDQRSNVCLGGFGLSAQHTYIKQKLFRHRHAQICKGTASQTLPKQIQSPLWNPKSMGTLINTHLAFQYTHTTQAPPKSICSQSHTHLLTHY